MLEIENYLMGLLIHGIAAQGVGHSASIERVHYRCLFLAICFKAHHEGYSAIQVSCN